ncbi:MAG: diguanylate cyclase [Nitrospirae bacterium]|nr:diguanylate cyclase [Nitrospirota bacterium]
MLRLNQDELRSFLTQIDQAIYNHNQWHECLIRALICHLPYDRREMHRNAHRDCLFGQWYYSPAAQKLKDHPGFEALGIEHENVHMLAVDLLQMEGSGTNIHILEFEKFTNALGSMRLQLQTLKRELEDMLYNRDSLTRAHSRIGMLTKLRELHELVKRGIQSCSIAMMDLDHFKEVNDTFGHAAGDKVLVSITHYILEDLRPYDRIFRYGGEEFLVTVLHPVTDNGLDAIERLRTGISEQRVEFEGGDIWVTASFGVAELDPEVPVEQSIERADKALYAAKAAGRNHTAVWEPSMEAGSGHQGSAAA